MRLGDKYVKIVEWSEEDECFVGSCPELFFGGCHGDDPQLVFKELCAAVDSAVELHEADGSPMPRPLSGLDIANRFLDLRGQRASTA